MVLFGGRGMHRVYFGAFLFGAFQYYCFLSIKKSLMCKGEEKSVEKSMIV